MTCTISSPIECQTSSNLSTYILHGLLIIQISPQGRQMMMLCNFFSKPIIALSLTIHTSLGVLGFWGVEGQTEYIVLNFITNII